MIFELAQIEVTSGKEAAFEAAVTQALPLFHRARGCSGVQLQRTLEHPSRYVLQVQWATLEDHTVHFRQSEDFGAWRALVGPFFAEGTSPVVVHTAVVVQSADAFSRLKCKCPRQR